MHVACGSPRVVQTTMIAHWIGHPRNLKHGVNPWVDLTFNITVGCDVQFKDRASSSGVDRILQHFEVLQCLAVQHQRAAVLERIVVAKMPLPRSTM